MRRQLTRTALLGSVFLMSGCAGIPTAVSVASIYVNSILFLRTNKGVADHAVSAAMDQDCGFSNILSEGEYCTDAPAPKVLVAMMADADALTSPSGDPVLPAPAIAIAETPAVEAAPVSATEPDGLTAAPTVVPTVTPKPTRTRVAVTAATDGDAGTHLVRHVRTADASGHRVVLGSYRSRATAGEHLARLRRDDAKVVAASSRGATVYRVVIETDSRDLALRELSLARAGGTPDAWVTGTEVAPAPSPAPGTRIAAPEVEPMTPEDPRIVEPIIPMLADVELTPII